MKTIKSFLLAIAIISVSGSVFATGKSTVSNDDVRKSVREKIAAVISDADFKGKGQVFVKFSIGDNNNLQVLKVESSDETLSATVKAALAMAKIKFPEGSKGFYQIKVLVNETNESFTCDMVRQQIMNSLDKLSSNAQESVDLRFRITNNAPIKVMKADSKNKQLAELVKKAVEDGNYAIPNTLNGEYNLKVTFK